MDNTPDSPVTLRQHFSRRASAARIAARNPNRNDPLQPLQPLGPLGPLPLPQPIPMPLTGYHKP
jgi:hypothetical protein